MTRVSLLLYTFLLATLFTVSAHSAPLVQSGNHVISFTGVAQSEEGAPGDVLYLRGIKFMAAGYQPVSELRLRDPAAKPLLGPGWKDPGREDSLTIASAGIGEIKCQIPYKAAGLVLDYVCPDYVDQPITMRLNNSRIALQPIHQRYECCVFLKRGLTGVVLANAPPAYNLWSVYNVALGPETHGEVRMEIALDNGNDPLSCGEYRLHVYAAREPDDEVWPNAQATFRLGGVDVSQYDGYIASITAPYATSGYASLTDTSNFSWGGGGTQVEAGKWARWAVPFETCRNYTTAGDGVLKLSQLSGLHMGVGNPSRAFQKEYLVGAPQFYTGNPPRGVTVVGYEDKKGRPTPMEELVPVPAKSRRPTFFEGTGIQSIAFSGDSVWLGTDSGLVRTSRSKPGLQLGRWAQAEGLVDDDVHAVRVDGNDVWVGTTGGVSRYDGSTFQNFTVENGLLPGPAMALAVTPEAVWVGMTRGLTRFDKKTKQLSAYRRYGGWAPESTGGQGVPISEGRGVYADVLTFDDQDGTVWHGAAGLSHTDAQGGDLGHQHGSTSRAIGIYPQGELLWYVDAGGITLQRKSGKEIKRYGLGRPLGIGNTYRSRVITGSSNDPTGNLLWVIYNDGVGFFDPTREQFHWSPAFSLALGGLVPQSVAADEQRLWVGTDNGLMIFDKSKASQPWLAIDYECPADVRAAGVKLGESYDVGCGDCWQRTFVDTTRAVNGGEGSLCLEFAVGYQKESKACLSHSLNLDVTGTSGLSFWAMSDRQRQFCVYVRRTADLTGKVKDSPTETWRTVVTLGPQWRKYTVPFAEMQRLSDEPKIPNQSVYITGIDFERCAKDFNCPGDTGRLWVDQLGWIVDAQARQTFGRNQ